MKRLLFALFMLGVSGQAKADPLEALNQYRKDHELKEGETLNSIFNDALQAARTPEERLEVIKNGLAGHQLMELELHKRGTQINEAAASILKTREFFNSLLTPRAVIGLGAAALMVFAGWHLTSVTAKVAGHYIMIPPLADKTNIRSWGDSIKRFFVYKEEEVETRNQLIFNKELTDQIDRMTESIKNAAQNDLSFRHCLLYGPAGTGKTKTSTAVAQEVGLKYIGFSASKLCQYNDEEGLKQITHIFEYAKNYPEKLMVIMEEADAIFANRDTMGANDKVQKFLNHILMYMGTEQNSFVVVALSNRPYVFDAAALSRFGIQIYVGPPGSDELKALFIQYGQKYFIDVPTENRDKRAFYQKLFSEKPLERKPLSIEPEALSDEAFDEYARLSEGLVGRDISDLLVGVQHAAYKPDVLTVRKDMILREIAQMKLKKEWEKNKFSSLPAAH